MLVGGCRMQHPLPNEFNELQEAYYLYKLPYLILICCFHVLIGHLTDAFLFGNLRQLILIQNFLVAEPSNPQLSLAINSTRH